MDVEIPEGTTILTMENSGGSNSVWANAQIICDRAVMDRLKTLSVQPEEPAVAVGDSTNLVISAYSNGQESIALTPEQCTYSSSNPEIATIDPDTGVITGVADGIATITCTVVDAVDPSISRTATCEIIVGEGEEGATWSVTSPDENISALFFMDAEGAVRFFTTYDGKTVVSSSPTGLVTNAGDFRNGLTFVSREDEEVTDSYDLIGAKVNHVDATANQMTLNFTKDGASYSIIVRVYDDGMALRYAIETEDGQELTISEENTGFQLASGSVAQAMEYEYANESVAQEEEAHRLRGGYCMPLLYETTDGVWALLSEADLNSTYCGAQLVGDGTRYAECRIHAGADGRRCYDCTVYLPVALCRHRHAEDHRRKHHGRNLERGLPAGRHQLGPAGHRGLDVAERRSPPYRPERGLRKRCVGHL